MKQAAAACGSTSSCQVVRCVQALRKRRLVHRHCGRRQRTPLCVCRGCLRSMFAAPLTSDCHCCAVCFAHPDSFNKTLIMGFQHPLTVTNIQVRASHTTG